MDTNEIETNQDDYKIEFLPEDYSQYDLSFKLIFIGDAGVGKSCLTTQAIKNTFEDYYQATIGFEFLTSNIKINDKIIKLQIWDTCGQEIYRSLISNFYRNSSLAVLIYAIDNKQSFDHVEEWLKDLKSQANPEIIIFLVGNKADLEDKRKITKEQGEKFKEEKDLDLFMETSAKTGFNAKNVLIEAAKLLYNNYNNYKDESEENHCNCYKDLHKKEKEQKQGCCK